VVWKGGGTVDFRRRDDGDGAWMDWAWQTEKMGAQ